MENPALGVYKEAEHIDLPPGFRFHPTDEELISYYLFSKTLDVNFTAVAIGEADFNKCEPWDLPKVAKMGEKEWYFFSLRDRKYPSGLRTNRATGTGYWKATGKDKEIYKARSLMGLKKTLVFYQGRAPKGEKSNWIMHEYRLFPSPDNSKNEWVICRVFHKSSSENKALLSNETPSAAHTDQTQLAAASSSDVPCLSQLINPAYPDIDPNYFSQGCYQSQINPFNPNSQYTFGDFSDQNMLLGSAVENSGGGLGTELNQGNPVGSSAVPAYDIGGDPFGDQAGPSMGPVDIDSFWNF